MKKTLPAMALTLTASIWGLSWWPLRQIQTLGLHPLWTTAVIYVVALGGLLLVKPGAWRGFGRQPLLWLLFFAAGLANVGFNWAATIGDVVRVVLLFYLMPAWALLLAWPLLGERPQRAAILRLALALAGVVIVLKTPASAWPLPEDKADWLALMGGFSFALTNVLLRKLHQAPYAACTLAMFGGGAALALLVAASGSAMGLIAWPAAGDYPWLGLALTVSAAIFIGNLALQYGATRLSANATALIMLIEVVVASLSSVALGAAELSARILFGGALILLASLLAALAAEEA